MPPLPIKIKDEDVLDALRYDIDKAKAVQDELALQREDYYKWYRGENYGNERTGWSQTVAPVIYNNIQWLLPSIMEIFNENFFSLRSDNEDRAYLLQKLIYYQMFRKQDGYRRIYDFSYNALLYHYGILKVCYKEDFDIEYDIYDNLSAEEMLMLAQDKNLTITKYTEAQGVAGETTYEKVKVAKKVVKYAGPHIECVPPWEFFYSPDCKVGDWGSLDGRLVYHEVTRTMNDIRKKERAGIYRPGSFGKVLESFEEAAKPSARPDSYEVLVGADDLSEHDTQAPEQEGQENLSKEVRIRECYYRLDIDGDGLLEPVIIDLCGETVLRLEENGYKKPPFRIGSSSPEPHKIIGMALAKVLDNDQRVQTNLLRLMQDSAAQSCYRNPVTNDHQMFKMLQDRKPFAVILGDPLRIGEVKQSEPSMFIMKALEYNKEEIEGKTGNTKYNQGQDSASLNKTATGISAIFNASEKRARMMISLLANGPIMGIIRDFIYINQKWPGEDPIKLLGQNLQVNPGDLTGEYDIEIDIGVSPSEKQSIANQLDLLIQFATQAGLQMGIQEPLDVLRAQVKKYRVLGINVSNLFLSEGDFKKKMAAQQQMMQQQAMAQGAQQGIPPGFPPSPGGMLPPQ